MFTLSADVQEDDLTEILATNGEARGEAERNVKVRPFLSTNKGGIVVELIMRVAMANAQ